MSQKTDTPATKEAATETEAPAPATETEVTVKNTTIRFGADGITVFTDQPVKTEPPLPPKEPAARPPAAEEAKPPLEIGEARKDGLVYAGDSPDSGKPMFVRAHDSSWMLSNFNSASSGEKSHKEDGGGFHLPSQAELNVLYENREKGLLKKAFNATATYWTSTLADGENRWAQDFKDGSLHSGGVASALYVWTEPDPADAPASHLDRDKDGWVRLDAGADKKLFVAPEDAGVMTYAEAKKEIRRLKKKGIDARLPTINELRQIFAHQAEIGGFKSAPNESWYLSGSRKMRFFVKNKNFLGGTESFDPKVYAPMPVRLVRD